jgi:hypothetical protein
MVPQGTISGKVVDEDGDLVNGASVELYHYVYVQGVKQLLPSGFENVLPDGSFMLGNIAAGRYYVSAKDTNATMMGGPQNERYGGKGPEIGYAVTYFPSAFDISSAAPVDISPGADVRGIEIRLRKTRLFHIRGKLVSSVAGVNLQVASLQIAAKGDGQMVSYRRGNTMVRNGGFEFSHLLAGTTCCNRGS